VLSIALPRLNGKVERFLKVLKYEQPDRFLDSDKQFFDHRVRPGKVVAGLSWPDALQHSKRDMFAFKSS
jgi:hypothetical protein